MMHHSFVPVCMDVSTVAGLAIQDKSKRILHCHPARRDQYCAEALNIFGIWTFNFSKRTLNMQEKGIIKIKDKTSRRFT